MATQEKNIRLTQYSHGAGCGCKISPEVLDLILEKAGKSTIRFDHLLVGNSERDDAAVMDLGDGTAIISTTDFFMPIVDDPETFGRIAATNAISDIYAMGGTPMMAIAILGWPINILSAEVAAMVIRGAQRACGDAGIPLAGGHSIDSPEPIFGLAVTGRVDVSAIKKNGGASPGDMLYLTKPLGIGVLSTALKKGILTSAHEELSVKWMTQLNTVGEKLGKMKGITAMTDVTGFGLAGHLMEMCRASNTSAHLDFADIPVIDSAVLEYILQGSVPGGTNRNYDSYGKEMSLRRHEYKALVCDPQTSGGLLIAVNPKMSQEVRTLLASENLWSKPIGMMVQKGEYVVEIF